jgi:hypothetical protein
MCAFLGISHDARPARSKYIDGDRRPIVRITTLYASVQTLVKPGSPNSNAEHITVRPETSDHPLREQVTSKIQFLSQIPPDLSRDGL